MPIIEQLAQEVSGKAKVAKLNIFDSPDLAAEYGVTVAPTLLIFQNGKTVYKTTGLQSVDTLKTALQPFVAN